MSRGDIAKCSAFSSGAIFQPRAPATLHPRLIRSVWLSATCTTRATPLPPRWLPLPLRSTGSDGLRRRPTIAGFALSPLTALATPEISAAITHLRDVLGDQNYESLAREGKSMTTSAMVTYAYDQIDQARAELNAVSK